MKKGLIIIFVFIMSLLLTGCLVEKVDDNQDKYSSIPIIGQFYWTEDIDLSLIDESKIEVINGYREIENMRTYNKSLIAYIVNIIKNIDFDVKLENKEEIDSLYIAKMGTINFTCNDYLFSVNLSMGNNIWIVGAKNGAWLSFYNQWAYKASDTTSFGKLMQFTNDISDLWYEENVLTKINTTCRLSKEEQEKIVKKYIDFYSPLADYFIDGTKFSGSIRGYYGSEGDNSAVIVDGCGLCYTEAEWIDTVYDISFNYNDGNSIIIVNSSMCYTLEYGRRMSLISQDFLEEIYINYNI